MDIEQNLFFAIYHEHKARTGHDIYIAKPLATINCDVCMYLKSINREYERMERQYYEQGKEPAP